MKTVLVKLSDLSPRMKSEVCNGVGPAGFGWLFPRWIAFNKVFRLAADGHDLAYWLGGTWRDRLAADNQFLKHCLQAAFRQGVRSMLYIPAAFVYWAAVRMGGSAAFHYGEKRTWTELMLIHFEQGASGR